MHEKILLGFEVPSGEPFYLDLHHLVITGMTELSGKTTAIEALIERSGLRAIVFKTKRGEKGFERVGRLLPLYFKERSDWQYVSSLIEATLREKMKFERSWIIRACKGAKTLREVYARVKEFLKKERLRALDRSIFTNLQAYLELVLPSIERLKFTDKLEIGPGVNVMDLEGLYAKPEVQALIIRSVMEYILEHERDIIVVVPECWKFLPQGRGSPVKIFFERFIREGATINNYLWLDSQDIAGVDKTPLRQVDNWILGRQRETHEVDRTIDAIPLPKTEKPKPLEIRRLKVGHFIAACGDKVKLVYVLPAGVPKKVGRKVATEKLTPEYVRNKFLVSRLREEDEEMYRQRLKEKEEELADVKEAFSKAAMKCTELEKKIKALEKQNEGMRKALFEYRQRDVEFEVTELKNRNKLLEAKVKEFDKIKESWERDHKELLNELSAAKEEVDKLKLEMKDLEDFKGSFQRLFLKDTASLPRFEPIRKETPSEVTVHITQPAITIVKERQPLTLRQADLEGRIAIVYAEGLLPSGKAFSTRQLNRIMESRFGTKEFPGNFAKVLAKFVAWGYLEKVRSGTRWDYRVKMSPEEAKEKGLLKEA